LPRSCGFPLRSGERRCKQPRLQSSRRLRRSSRVLTSTVASLDGTAEAAATKATLLGFRSLQHLPAKRVHDPRTAPPPAAFRLQGLATLLAACSPRRLVGPLSSRQRSWDSPYGAFSSWALLLPGFSSLRGPHLLKQMLLPTQSASLLDHIAVLRGIGRHIPGGLLNHDPYKAFLVRRDQQFQWSVPTMN
jgi:hypothetical protein